MKTTKPAVNKKTNKTNLNKALPGVCYGVVHSIEEATDTIWVDYPNNPSKSPLPAKLACPYITLDDLKRAVVNVSLVQLDFVKGNLSQPLVRDIFFSFANQVKNRNEKIVEKTVHVLADRLILEGTQEVVIKSGAVTTVYEGEKGQLTEEADSIRSTAKSRHRMQSGAVLIN